ncbi:LysR family transcriptional regulator [Pelagimonas varians]|uniref:HTH-type transcriptional regulator DmlR n=1 Tax=Pelagimonas varians TaxID=696760 RepID=A0A238JU85_9RHOB|nr:LysR family transcriptional regulator [Pelagimonas varians]PYG34514.1 LysR family transcriptional regulator [Pelagimonas varians]SMX33757.1 HTH-type transcriptional regulator DmlR [Pelagimonas varians]
MIEKLRSIAIFSTVVDQNSFRGASLYLGLAPSRVSEVVSQLEADLGVTLLYRTTRQLSLTHEGRLLHEKAQTMLAAAEAGLDAVSTLSHEPSGSLRVSVPAFIAQTQLMDRFAEFLAKYPSVDVNFHFSDRRSDLIKDGFDAVIRAGWLDDSEFMSRSIGHTERFLVASPEYVTSKGAPTSPKDLENWDWIRFKMRTAQTELTSPSGDTVSVLGKSNVTVNSAEALHEFAIRGLGVSSVPKHLASRGFERGELVHILPEWSLRPLGLYAVWPNQSRRENLTTLFVRFLSASETTAGVE